MRAFVFFVVGVLTAALGLWFLFPERVQLVAQIADDHAVREPPRPLEDDRALVKLASVEKSLAALNESFAAAQQRRAKEAGAANERAVALDRQILELRQELAALATTVATLSWSAPHATPPVVNADPAPAVEPAPAPILEEAPPAEPAPETPPPPPPPPRTLFKLVAESSKVGFDGSSNLHDFTGATTAVKGEIEFRPDQQDDAPRAVVEIDARTLDTGNSSRDKEMHNDFIESKKFTTMQFRIESLAQLKVESAARFQGRARGTFTCHGREKRVEAAFKAERVGATGLRIEGEMPLKMSDFGISPPTSLGGLIRTRDDVRVWFVLQARCEP